MQSQSQASSSKLNLDTSSTENTQEATQLPEGWKYVPKPQGIQANQVVFKTHLQQNQPEAVEKTTSNVQSHGGFIKSFSNIDSKAIDKEAESSPDENLEKLENEVCA